MRIKFWALLFLSYGLLSCQENQSKKNNTESDRAQVVDSGTKKYRTIGSIERLDPEIDQLFDKNAVPEIVAEGFDWAEGPLWVKEKNMLLFSDVPQNKIYKWTENGGTTEYLTPSGYTEPKPRGGEMGSNGLTLNKDGRLVLCQHGNRQIALMNAPVDSPQIKFITIAGKYNGKRINSPNDVIFSSTGNLYFTDPPFGLEKVAEDPAKELPFQGVYKVSPDGKITLLTNKLSRPNGIAFSPDEKRLYVSNCDAKNAVWMVYDVTTDGNIADGKVFFDATSAVGKGEGLPDGMKVHKKEYLFCAGTGGLWIFNPQGKHIGTINTTQKTSNCAFNEDYSKVYITADQYIVRLSLLK